MPAMDYSKIADLYDVYAVTQIDVQFFLHEAKGCRRVLELTSGTGRLSLPLLQAGIALSCLDNSPDMLAILRRKLTAAGLSAPVHEMDAGNFAFAEKFDLIIFPFNSFSELVEPASQAAALRGIRSHLADDGRFICTFHNPVIRLQGADGQMKPRGQYLLPDKSGTLFLSSFEEYDAGSQIVKGAQFYEIYDADGVLQSKRFVTLRFFLHSKESFEDLALAQGFAITNWYGDYTCSEFDATKSLFMIAVLTRQ